MSDDIRVVVTEGQDINVGVTEGETIDVNYGGCPTEGLNAGNFIYDEIPGGTIDGTNKLFTIANEYISSKLTVYLNGIREINFIEKSDTTFELNVAPLEGDCVTVDYIKRS
jgi:hypothetical protein